MFSLASLLSVAAMNVCATFARADAATSSRTHTSQKSASKISDPISAPQWRIEHWAPDGAAVLIAASPATANQAQATHPASITKLLTALVALESIAAGEHRLDSQSTISAQAMAQDGSRVGYRVGESVSLADLLQAMLAISGNDAAWAVAEHVAGSTPAFVARMNALNTRLALTHSQWTNPHGLSDAAHQSSAADLLKIAHVLWQKYPQARPWLSVKQYTWNGLTQANRNSLLRRDFGLGTQVDGLKTGRTDAAGYNLALTTSRRTVVGDDVYDWRLSTIVLGAETAAARAQDSAALLHWAWANYVPTRLYASGAFAGKLVIAGAAEPISVRAAAPLWVVLPIGTQASSLIYSLHPNAALAAPQPAGSALGELRVSAMDTSQHATVLARVAVTTPVAIERAPVWMRFKLWLRQGLKSILSFNHVLFQQ